MRLLKITLTGQYKSLRNQTFDFSNATSNVIAFIGLNGMGKSQLLELIAESFCYIERFDRQDFKRPDPLPFEVTITTETNQSIPTASDSNQCQIKICRSGNVTIEGDWQQPYVIGYSSGLNENLQRPFLKNTIQFFNIMQVRGNRTKRTQNLKQEEIERINSYYLSRHSNIFKKLDQDNFLNLAEADTTIPSNFFLDYDSNALLMATLGLALPEELAELFPEIPFRYPAKFSVTYDLRHAPITFDAISDIRQLMEIVGPDAVQGIGKKTTDSEFDNYELDFLNAKINIDLTITGQRDALRAAYENSPIVFFKKFFKILLLGAQHWKSSDKTHLQKSDFFGNVKKPLKTNLPLEIVNLKLADENNREISFDDLSDGESQLIQVIGAVFLFKDEETLFLYDEPESHLNPAWRTNFHRHLTAAQSSDSKIQIILSTHSPFLISSLHRENVFEFNKINSEITVEPALIETYGTSFDVLIKQHFKLRTTMSQTAADEIREQLKNPNLSDQQRRTWIENNVGDSMEKAYLLKRLENKNAV